MRGLGAVGLAVSLIGSFRLSTHAGAGGMPRAGSNTHDHLIDPKAFVYGMRDLASMLRTAHLTLLANTLFSRSPNPGPQLIAEVGFAPGNPDEPVIKLSWSEELFVKPNRHRMQWQIWRSDVVDSPVLVIPGSHYQGTDGPISRSTTYFRDLPIGGTNCIQWPPTSSRNDIPGVIPGRPYSYQIELVYIVNASEVPGATTGGSTTTQTTGNVRPTTTTSGTSTAGWSDACYFVTHRQTARGIVTPYRKPKLLSPLADVVIGAPVEFTFQSVMNPIYPTTVEYIVQIGSAPGFPRNGTITMAKFQRSEPGILKGPAVNASSVFPQAKELWWRVGARNVVDVPGPTKDSNGQRYIWSDARRFTR